jgi:hypothetical protein
MTTIGIHGRFAAGSDDSRGVLHRNRGPQHGVTGWARRADAEAAVSLSRRRAGSCPN